MRIVAAVLVLVLVLAFGAWKQQDAPLKVTCGSVSGGATATGVTWARKAGGWLHNVAENPDQYRNPDNVKRTLDGMFRKVLWYWVTAGVQSARGEKIDPHILKLEQDRAQAVKDAAAACCPSPTPPPPDDPEEWDPRMASTSSTQGFSGENMAIARVVLREQERAGLPYRASVVATAAAMQESGPNGPRNLGYGHSSSVGAWQLIDSHGTRAQRMDPTFSVRWFYRQLKKVDGWQQMSVNGAAWRVEQPRADLRGLYGRWEDDARRLLAAATRNQDSNAPEESPGYTAGGCVPVGETSEVDVSEGRTQTIPAPGNWDYPGQRTVDQAIAWMSSQDARNTGGWQARCLAAVGQAYGHPGTSRINGRFWARDQWTAMPARYRLPAGANPPRGALVFWDTGTYGHIAISNGDGRVWTTDPPGRSGQVGLVPITTIDTWGKRVGVAAPWFPGKTGAAA